MKGQLLEQVEREILVQQNLKHENVLRLFLHFEERAKAAGLLAGWELVASPRGWGTIVCRRRSLCVPICKIHHAFMGDHRLRCVRV